MACSRTYEDKERERERERERDNKNKLESYNITAIRDREKHACS